MKTKKIVKIEIKLSTYELELIEEALSHFAEHVKGVETEKDCLNMAAQLAKILKE